MKSKRLLGIYAVTILFFFPALIYSSLVFYNYWFLSIIFLSIAVSYGIFMLNNWARVMCTWLTVFGWLYFLLVDVNHRAIKPLHLIFEHAILYFIPAGIIILYLISTQLKNQLKDLKDDERNPKV